MHESSDLRVGGVATFWHTARYTARVDLQRGLENLGLEKVCPPARAPENALRGALEECFPSRLYRIEPLKNKKAFEVVVIERGEERNCYQHTFWVGIDKDLQVEIRPFDYEVAGRVVGAFNKHLGLVSANAVTQTLLAVISHLQGTHLPGRGNIYWLPDTRLPEWREVAHIVERARTTGGHSGVYVIRHQLDHDAVRAVRDAIVQEVSGESEKMHEEIMGGALGEKALLTRQKEVDALRQKISLYEDLLQVGLGDLKLSLDRAEEAACAARLLSGPGVMVSA